MQHLARTPQTMSTPDCACVTAGSGYCQATSYSGSSFTDHLNRVITANSTGAMHNMPDAIRIVDLFESERLDLGDCVFCLTKTSRTCTTLPSEKLASGLRGIQTRLVISCGLDFIYKYGYANAKLCQCVRNAATPLSTLPPVSTITFTNQPKPLLPSSWRILAHRTDRRDLLDSPSPLRTHYDATSAHMHKSHGRYLYIHGRNRNASLRGQL